jgi:hypothetical protein
MVIIEGDITFLKTQLPILTLERIDFLKTSKGISNTFLDSLSRYQNSFNNGF